MSNDSQRQNNIYCPLLLFTLTQKTGRQLKIHVDIDLNYPNKYLQDFTKCTDNKYCWFYSTIASEKIYWLCLLFFFNSNKNHSFMNLRGKD